MILAPAVTDVETIADLLARLGDIPAHRVLWKPTPGTAREEDVIAAEAAPRKRLCELIDGTLVEKAVGQYESRVAVILSHFLETYLDTHDIGICYGESAMLRMYPGRVRMPDIAFVSWDRLPGHELPAEAVASLIPNLAVEVLSESNTRGEMKGKREDYFGGGAQLVWEIDPDKQTARVFTDVDQFQEIGPDGVLEGGTVLPGFTLPMRQLFARAGRKRSS